MVRQLLGNIKGQKGDKGDQGVKGDTGEISDINANIIPMSLNDWLDNEHYSTTTGEAGAYTGRSRLKSKIPVVKGETYTISDESTYVSQLNGIRWYIYDGGEFIESNAITIGQEKQITMTGDEITFALYPSSGMSNPARFIEHTDNRLLFKLERGSTKTKNLNVLNHYDRKLSYHDVSLKGSVDMVIDTFHFDAGDISSAHIIDTYSANRNTETLNSNGEFILSKGAWQIDVSLRIKRLKESSGFYTLLLYKNGLVSKRTLKSANTYDSITLSTTLFCEEGDTVKLGIFAFYMSVGEMTDGFDIDDSQGSTYLTMKKIGGL